MQQDPFLALDVIEQRICDIAATHCGVKRTDVHPHLRIVKDLHCDSLDFVELLMEVENAFGVDIPDSPESVISKTVFTRPDLKLCDLAELVYVHQSDRSASNKPRHHDGKSQPKAPGLFTQLGGVHTEPHANTPLYESSTSPKLIRRRTDGMTCVHLPAADVTLGSDTPDSHPDERPLHMVRLSAFLIDKEPVSTTAYCRFLNSIGHISSDQLADWFELASNDKRGPHRVIHRRDGHWRPVDGCHHLPMMLVSWFGANAYSLWANAHDWTRYRSLENESFLPSEAQWEYAARGPSPQTFPWGNEQPTSSTMQFGLHRPRQTYAVDSLPLAQVHQPLGMTAAGIHHMAGNIWQWCRDWYDPGFYSTPQALESDPVNRNSTGVRSERGGSWIGPAFLCRSSYRRGRAPHAKGRCLGFRCISTPPH